MNITAEDKTYMFHMRIQPGLAAALRAMAKKRGLSASELVRRYITAGMVKDVAARAQQGQPQK